VNSVTSQGKCYFERVGPYRFQPTSYVQGAWNTSEQHIAPVLGLLAHAIEVDFRARGIQTLRIGRLSYDILGTIPIDAVDIAISILRHGRTVELIEARLTHNGRTAVILTAWLMRGYDTASLAGTAFPSIPDPNTMPPWKPSTIWRGGFIRTLDVRRFQSNVGRAISWIRTDISLIGGEQVSSVARALSIIDIANGLTPRVLPEDAAFPNIDLTVHLFNIPEGDWLGLDTTVSFGADGVGLTHSIVHDINGPIGTVSQCLTIRPL
jgi:hypothetical protein